MKLPEHERQAHRDAFRAMSLAQKADYIFAYYKLPLVLAFIVLVALGSVLNYKLTHRDAVLYVGLVNVAADDALFEELTDEYLDATGRDARRQEVLCYRDLYLSNAETTADHQYSYASRLKVLASVDAEQLDVVLMDHKAYDLLSHGGYLMDLSTVDLGDLKGLVLQNEVVLEDNQVEVDLGEAEEYQAVTRTDANALDASSFDLFGNLSGDVYLGIVGNTPRLDESVAYLHYLKER